MDARLSLVYFSFFTSLSINFEKKIHQIIKLPDIDVISLQMM